MMKRILLLLVITAPLIFSCRSTRKIQTAIAKKDSVQVVVDSSGNSREDSLAVIRQGLENIKKSTIHYTTFSAKLNVDYSGTDQKNHNMNVNLRMYKDSVIWISITAILGIEGLRAYITKDSVKILNKQDKIYMARSVAFLQEVTALPLDLQSLQDILIGNPVFFDSTGISYSGDWFRNLLTINETGRIENSKLDDVDVKRSRTCNLHYSDYENKKGVFFSTNRRITVAEKANLDIKFEIKSYDFNETLSFPFTVPKNYKRN